MSLNVMLWFVQTPSAIVIVSPGAADAWAVVISAALWTRKSVARAGETAIVCRQVTAPAAQAKPARRRMRMRPLASPGACLSWRSRQPPASSRLPASSRKNIRSVTLFIRLPRFVCPAKGQFAPLEGVR